MTLMPETPIAGGLGASADRNQVHDVRDVIVVDRGLGLGGGCCSGHDSRRQAAFSHRAADPAW